MELILGQPLGDCLLNIKRQSRQRFAVDWFNDEAQQVPSNLTGVTMTIFLGPRDTPLRSWVGTNVGNRTTWDLSELETTLEFDQYGGVMIMDDGTGEILLFRVKAEVED